MRNLKLLLQREPAAVGSLVASVMPLLVLLGVVRIDEAGIAAVVVAVNTVVGFGVRLAVSPTAGADESRARAEMGAAVGANG
jgi:mRNA-degrading endonuclease toxin of MazEF toxin-antitoxin module